MVDKQAMGGCTGCLGGVEEREEVLRDIALLGPYYPIDECGKEPLGMDHDDVGDDLTDVNVKGWW